MFSAAIGAGRDGQCLSQVRPVSLFDDRLDASVATDRTYGFFASHRLAQNRDREKSDKNNDLRDDSRRHGVGATTDTRLGLTSVRMKIAFRLALTAPLS